MCAASHPCSLDGDTSIETRLNWTNPGTFSLLCLWTELLFCLFTSDERSTLKGNSYFSPLMHFLIILQIPITALFLILEIWRNVPFNYISSLSWLPLSHTTDFCYVRILRAVELTLVKLRHWSARSRVSWGLPGPLSSVGPTEFTKSTHHLFYSLFPSQNIRNWELFS